MDNEATRLECPLCGGRHEGMYERFNGPHRVPPAARLVCGLCADYIANAYSLAHSGVPFTWPRERKAAGYQKGQIPERLRWQVFERDNFTCKHCGSKRMLRADHVEPESRGGPTTLENLQTLCHSCNSSKGARHADDWRSVEGEKND